MPRVVPIIHRAPPPTLEQAIAAPVVPIEEQESADKARSFLKSVVPKNERRSYISTAIHDRATSASANGHTKSAKASGSQDERHFTLFDALQELALSEADFAQKLGQDGLELKVVAGDGNCMFRSVADQVYGDEDMHEQVRACCLDYMEQESEFFREFVPIDFAKYTAEKRKLKVFGDHLELQAMAELYNRPIEIRIPGKEVLRIGDVENDKAAKPMRLSYHNKNHYNSIRDPNDKTVGLGLGLPANQKPTTDKTLVAEAVEQSLKSDAEKQVLDTVKLESAQQDLDEELLKAQAIEESELMDVEEQLLEHELHDDEYYAQQLQQEMDEQEMEAAIRMSLLEAEESSRRDPS